MIKKRNITLQSNTKTCFLFNFLLIIGLILLIIYIIQSFVSSLTLEENLAGTILAFSILFLGSGIIIFFFHCQFAKLSKIAEEVEKGFDSENLNNSK
jgi:hypothetical protein